MELVIVVLVPPDPTPPVPPALVMPPLPTLLTLRSPVDEAAPPALELVEALVPLPVTLTVVPALDVASAAVVDEGPGALVDEPPAAGPVTCPDSSWSPEHAVSAGLAHRSQISRTERSARVLVVTQGVADQRSAHRAILDRTSRVEPVKPR